jgi:beta-1,4-mannosyltransferase
MRILLGCDTIANPFLGQLIASLSCHKAVISVNVGTTLFWMGPKNFDILHLHWPESLFYWREPDAVQLEKLEEKLCEWKTQCRLVSTVHNLFPHYRNTSAFGKLYETIYRHSNAIIHFGISSRELFQSYYCGFDHLTHYIIPHGDYTYFENIVSRAEARKYLNLPENLFVCLSFGQLRDWEEFQFINKGFRIFSHPSKTLLIAGRISYPDNRLKSLFIRYKESMLKRFKKTNNRLLYDRLIPDYQVQYLLNAADLFIVPRLKALNSGNVALGFTFGKVVVGTSFGVIGEVLQETGNPTFTPGDINSLADALNRGVELVQNQKGLVNREYATEHWNWERIADMHVEVYKPLIG